MSSKVVDAEVQQLSARLQQAEATASEMQNQVTTQASAIHAAVFCLVMYALPPVVLCNPESIQQMVATNASCYGHPAVLACMAHQFTCLAYTYCSLSQVQANQDLQTSLQRAQLHEAQANRLQEHLQRLQAELQKVQVTYARSGGLHTCFVALLLR